jgi:hypothetical protein
MGTAANTLGELCLQLYKKDSIPTIRETNAMLVAMRIWASKTVYKTTRLAEFPCGTTTTQKQIES